MTLEREHLFPNTDSEFTYDELDKEIISVSTNFGFPQTKYQCENFVSRSYPTLYRQLRQTFLEIESREHSIAKMDVGLRKCLASIKIKEKEIEDCRDEYQKEYLKVELDDLIIDRKVWEKKFKMAHEEMRIFLDFLKSNGITNREDATKAIEYNHEEEHKYWIARMAKQSTVDILTQGRIGAGNLDSILMMEEEDQVATMQLALDYSSALGVGLHNLRLNAEEKVKDLLEGKQIPALSYLEQVKTQYDTPEKLLQSTYQPETQS